MAKAPVITLTTDFGTADGYVGAMKGVLVSDAPSIPLVDISHDLPAFDRTAALLLLRQVVRRFPGGTVHVVVVDPGVGTSRRGLIMKANDQFFVGADNGILPALFPPSGIKTWAIDNEKFPERSATFHGRDVFAPVAAGIANGVPVSAYGKPIDDAERLSLPMASVLGNLVKGEIIHVDRFGNLISNIPRGAVDADSHVAISLNRTPIHFGKTFGDVEPGQSVAYWGSQGLLEVAVREGSASERYGGTGLPIEVLRYA